MLPVRITSSGRRAIGVVALISAILLTVTNSASAGRPLLGFFNPRPASDPTDYVRNSAVLPSYYWSVSKFDRANAGAFGAYTPPLYPPGCYITTPSAAQNDDPGYSPDPPSGVGPSSKPQP